MRWLTSLQRRRAARGEPGAAAVEFALISIIFIPLILGMMGFGLILWGLQAADHAAREAARLAAVGVSDCAAWRKAVQLRGQGAFSQVGDLDSSDAKFVLDDFDGDGDEEVGDQITVTLTYEITGHPGWMVEAAAAILPGTGTIAMDDGSDGTGLVIHAYTRNEAPASSATGAVQECA